MKTHSRVKRIRLCPALGDGLAEAGNLHSPGDWTHLLLGKFFELAFSVIDGGGDEILEHLYFLRVHNLRRDGDALELLPAVESGRDNSTAGRPFDYRCGQLFLRLEDALLKILNLLQHVAVEHKPSGAQCGRFYQSGLCLPRAGSRIGCSEPGDKEVDRVGPSSFAALRTGASAQAAVCAVDTVEGRPARSPTWRSRRRESPGSPSP